jgi:hypothetical protein
VGTSFVLKAAIFGVNGRSLRSSSIFVDFRRGRRTAADLRKVRSQKMCVREMRDICVEIALPMPPQGGRGVSILGICFAESISVVESSFVVSFACGGVRGNGWGCCGIVLVR